VVSEADREHLRSLKGVHERRPIVRLWPEYGNAGLWNPPTLTSMAVGPCIDGFALPEDLDRDYASWRWRYEEGPFEAPRPPGYRETFLAEQLNLTVRISSFLGELAWMQCEIGGFLPTY